MRLARVYFMPKEIESGVLYVSERFQTAAHLCACGCKTRIRTPLGPEQWSVDETETGPSLSPSVGNWQQSCRSHYWISRGKITWSFAWTAEQIDAGRRYEEDRLRAHHSKLAVERILVAAAPERSADLTELLERSKMLFFHWDSETRIRPTLTEQVVEELWLRGESACRVATLYKSFAATAERIALSELDAMDLERRTVAQSESSRNAGTEVVSRDPNATRSIAEQELFQTITVAIAYIALREIARLAASKGTSAQSELDYHDSAHRYLIAPDVQLSPELIKIRTLGIALGIFLQISFGESSYASHGPLHELFVTRRWEGDVQALNHLNALLIARLHQSGRFPKEMTYTDRSDLLSKLIQLSGGTAGRLES